MGIKLTSELGTMFKSISLGTTSLVLAMAATTAVSALDVNFAGRIRFEAAGGTGFVTTSGGNAILIDETGDNLVAYTNTSGVLAAGSTITTGLTSTDDVTWSNNERLDVNVTGGYARGFQYGGKLRIQDGGIASNIYLKGDWGRLDFGDIENARGGAFDISVVDAGPIAVGTSATWTDTGSNVANGSATRNAANDMKFDGTNVSGASIVYTMPKVAGLSVKIGTDGQDFDGSVSGSITPPSVLGLPFGPIAYNIAASDNGSYGARAKMNFGDFTVAAFTGEDDDNDYYVGGGVSYNLGAIKLSASTSESRGDNKDHTTVSTGSRVARETDTVIGASYKLASGLTLSAAYANEDNKFANANHFKARLQLDF